MPGVPASTAGQSPTGGAGVEGQLEAPGGGDVLERLRQMQLAESQATGPERHWGETESRARDALEAFAHSEGEDREEAREAAVAALEEAEPAAVDGDGFLLLHYAAMYGCAEAIAVLTRRKANVNVRTKVHETPLQLAAYYRHAEACALLLARRARADLADAQGRTPLAAAKESKCGNGPDNNGQGQAACVRLLAERAEKEAAWREARPAEAEEEKAAAAALLAGAREAAELRQQGNAFFGKGQYKEAVASYSIALSFLDDGVLYSNRAECYLKLQRHLEAKLDAQKAVGLAGEAGNRKASWRLGRACLALGDLGAAAEAARTGLRLWPEDAALRQLARDAEAERRRRLRGGEP